MGKLDQRNAEVSGLFRASGMREKMGMVLEKHPQLRVEDILEMAGVARMNVKNVLYRELPDVDDHFYDSVMGACKGLLNGMIIPESDVIEKDSEYDAPLVLYKPFLSRGRYSRKFLLNQDYFRDYIHFLRDDFPGYGAPDFERMAKLGRGRIGRLLRREKEGDVHAYPDEIDRIRQLHRSLEKKREVSGIKKVKTQPKRKRNIILIHRIRDKYDLTNQEVAAYMGINYWRFRNIVYSKKMMTPEEADTFDKLETDFEQGLLTFPVKSIVVHPQNLRQLIDFLKISFSGLTVLRMEQLCGMRRDLLPNLLMRDDQITMPYGQAQALWHLYEKLKKEPQLYNSKIPVDKRKLNDLVGALNEMVSNLQKRSVVEKKAPRPLGSEIYIARLLGIGPDRLYALRYRENCRYYRSEEYAKVQEIECHFNEGSIDDLLKEIVMKAE